VDALDDKHQFQRQSGEGRVQAGAVSGVLTDVGINVADIYRCVWRLRQFFVIPKSELTPSEKVWELLIQPCENSLRPIQTVVASVSRPRKHQ
jgi:hypothetical protein